MPIIEAIKESIGSSDFWSTVFGVFMGSNVLGGDLVGEMAKSASGQTGWYGVGVEAGVKGAATILSFAGGKMMPTGGGKNFLYGVAIGNMTSALNDATAEGFRKPVAVSAMSVPGVIGARLGAGMRAMLLGSHSHSPIQSALAQQRLHADVKAHEPGMLKQITFRD